MTTTGIERHAGLRAELYAWGAWVARQLDGGRGYPRRDSTCRGYQPGFRSNDAAAAMAASQQRYDAITRAVEQLEPAARRLVLLRFRDQQPISRISEATGMRPQTARDWIERALERISDALADAR